MSTGVTCASVEIRASEGTRGARLWKRTTHNGLIGRRHEPGRELVLIPTSYEIELPLLALGWLAAPANYEAFEVGRYSGELPDHND